MGVRCGPRPHDMIADVREEMQAGGSDTTGELAQMMARLRTGDVRALARAVSMVEDGSALGAELAAACCQFSGTALRIGVTGPPGAGKSTLVDQMVRWLRGDGQTVGVVAIDPSSPYTGGALLGDRIRMQGFAGDEGVYIRSMASRGAMGGLARAAKNVCCVIEAAGRQTLVIETVGVGQDEVEVIGLADVTVLVLVPGMGDDVQSLKAGVMEIADVFVVNKADHGGAELVEQEIVEMQGLTAAADVVSVVRTVATTGEGVPELMEAVRRCALRKKGHAKRLGRVSLELAKLRLDHLGVAVKSIDDARRFYERLGLFVSGEEIVAHERARTAMLPLGESRIELIEATDDASPIQKFVTKRGEGLHHVAVHVDGADGVDAMFAKLTAEGIRLASDSVRIGAGGHRYFFVHPASTGGVLLEIVGDSDAPSRTAS